MYAILDIETTGGKYNEEGITEIAIYRFDGHEVVDQFISLINPERPIQPYVSKLTGITNNMLVRAPKFYEVAKRIVEITDCCTLVAHNAAFDSRILATEFERLGYQYNRESLCTVELAKRIIPGLPSYSLGKLVKHLGIPLSNRHRAHGDAKATVSLFKLLLSKDKDKEIISVSIKENTKKPLHSKHLDLIETIPSETGVYYIYNNKKRIIYIGRGKNMKKKIIQHFTNQNNKSKRLQAEVESIAFEKTGSKLISLIKEHEEIKKTKPAYNSYSKRNLYSHQLKTTVDDNGLICLNIEKADGRKRSIATFSNYYQAEMWTKKLMKQNEFATDFNGEKDNISIKNSDKTERYNNRMREILEKFSLSGKNELLIDHGRTIEERSLIWIENGKVKGYGYFDLNHQITRPEILNNIITPVIDVQNTTHIVHKYLRTNSILKIIPLPSSVNSQ